MSVTRREFLGQMVAAPFAALAAGRILSACGGDDFEERHRFMVTAPGTVLSATRDAGKGKVNCDEIPVDKNLPHLTAPFVYAIGMQGQWVFTVNGEEPGGGALSVLHSVKPGDEIIWYWAPSV